MKKRKEKSLPKLKNELQMIFNRFIRLRDKGLPCISCGQYKFEMQAGHFYPVKGYDGLRYDEENVHGECAGCNGFDDAHLIGYADNLLGKIGGERLKALKERAAEYKRNGYKFSRSEISEKIEYYKRKVAELENNT